MTGTSSTHHRTGELTIGGLLGRLPISMVGVAPLVQTSGPNGDGATTGGLLAAAFGLASAATSPLWGALADRATRRRVLTITSLTHAPALVAVHLAIEAATPRWFQVLVVVAAGAAQPPITGALRAHWADLPPHLGGPARTREVALTELVFVAGPVIVAATIATGLLPPLGAAACLSLAGWALLARTGALDQSPADHHSPTVATVAPDAIPTRNPSAIWGLAAISAARVGAVAATEVALIARADDGATASLAVACLAAGSVLGGLTLGRRPPSRTGLLVLTLGGAGLIAFSAIPIDGVWLLPLAATTCVASAPLAIAIARLTDDHTTPRTRARAHSLIGGTAQYVGAAAGFALAGPLVQHIGPTPALALPCLLLVAATAAIPTASTPPATTHAEEPRP